MGHSKQNLFFFKKKGIIYILQCLNLSENETSIIAKRKHANKNPTRHRMTQKQTRRRLTLRRVNPTREADRWSYDVLNEHKVKDIRMMVASDVQGRRAHPQ